MSGVCLSLISLNLINRFFFPLIMEPPRGVLFHGKVFKIYGHFETESIIPQRFYRDFRAMLHTFLQLEAERLGFGDYYATAWASHGYVRGHFCYYFTFAGREYHRSDLDSDILCSNLARRLLRWVENELSFCYPNVTHLNCLPLANELDESTFFD